MFSQKPLFKAIALTSVMAFPCLSVPAAFSQEPNIEDFDFEGFLGGNVWEDENENGFQGSRSAPEQGIEDVSVTLTDDQGKPLQTTTTNKNGFYYFRGLEEGDYSVQFERPENCEFTQKDRYNQYDPRFDYWDSDADKDSGAGETIRIDREHRFDFTSDAGIVFDDFPAPQAPMLYPDAVSLNVGETVEVDVLANDQLNGDVDEFFIDDRNFPGKIQIVGSSKNNGLVIVTADFLDGEFGVPYSVVVNGQLVTSKLWVTIEKPATLAVDDQVSAFVGDQITVDILANDIISEAVDVVRILGTDVPGRVFINRANNLVVRDTRATGRYKVEYEVISTDGSRSTALVNIVLEERPIPTIANDDAAQGLINETLVIDILANDQPSEAVASIEFAGSDLPEESNVSLTDNGELVIEGVSQAGTYTVEYDLISTSGSTDNAWVTVTFSEPEPDPVVQQCRSIGDVANLVVQHSQKSVEVAQSSQENGADIQQREFINGANQQWELLPVSGGFSLQARHSGQCMDVSDDKPQNGANVFQAYCGHSDRQVLNWQGDQLVFNHSGLCLTMKNNFLDNGASFVQASCQNADNQRFFAACLDDPAPKPKPPAVLLSCNGGSGWDSVTGPNRQLNISFDSTKTIPFIFRTLDAKGKVLEELKRSEASVNIDPNQGVGNASWNFYWGSGNINNTSGIATVQAVSEEGLISKPIECSIYVNPTPIALDTDNSGRVERINTRVSFDFAGNGNRQTVNQWFAPSEGILIDTRFEGHITGQQLFGDQGGLFTDGYAKLAMFDSDKNGWVEGVELYHLGIWTDTNSNAKMDSGELSTLANHNIVSLSTAHTNYLSEAKLANGQTMLSEDVWFSIAAPAVDNSAIDAAELTTPKSRLPMVLSLLAVISSGITAIGLFSHRKSES